MLNGVIVVAQVIAGVLLYARFRGNELALLAPPSCAFVAHVAVLRMPRVVDRTGTSTMGRAVGMAVFFIGLAFFITVAVASAMYGE